MDMDMIIQDFEDALLRIDRVKAQEIFDVACQGASNTEVLEVVIMNSLEVIGDKWEKGDVSLAQVYMSGIICEELITKYIPERQAGGNQPIRIAIGVLLDHHGLGKRIVLSVLRSAGYEVLDLGQGVTAEQMVTEAMANQTDVLLISTLMLHSALEVRTVRELCKQHKYPVTMIVGGAPFRLNSHLWQEVEADQNGKNAANVLRLIKDMTTTARQDDITRPKRPAGQNDHQEDQV